jgi:hypothetical protein
MGPFLAEECLPNAIDVWREDNDAAARAQQLVSPVQGSHRVGEMLDNLAEDYGVKTTRLKVG